MLVQIRAEGATYTELTASLDAALAAFIAAAPVTVALSQVAPATEVSRRPLDPTDAATVPVYAVTYTYEISEDPAA